MDLTNLLIQLDLIQLASCEGASTEARNGKGEKSGKMEIFLTLTINVIISTFINNDYYVPWQETLEFEDGFLNVIQPMQAMVGVEKRLQ